MQVKDSTFDGNTATNGGAIFNYGRNNGNASPVIIRSTFKNNTASNSGGAIYNDGQTNGESSPRIGNSTFYNNVAGYGGVLFNDGRYGTSSPWLVAVTLGSNYASSDGSGMTNAGLNGIAAPQIVGSVLWDTGSSEIYNSSANPAFYHSIVRDGCPPEQLLLSGERCRPATERAVQLGWHHRNHAPRLGQPGNQHGALRQLAAG